ncbi:hypothetical protein B0H98_107182 [Vreelandella songnenensis]|uniref:Uncharacterized protein n=1 Tax=Vreelandella songnenensis TaxID=1176243 RepID=A0A2T0V1P7_9GAMM|nr:hypothetical protein [Halomonas songnenensis]PRY64037.1 hypothetical protein B0H98_107182 [Halomonas songnenensis]
MQQDVRIISRSAVFSRWIFPAIWLIVASFITSSFLYHLDGFTIFILFPFGMIAFMVFSWKKAYAGVANRVYDNGESLTFVYGKERQQVYLKDVMNINYESMVSPDKVILTLRATDVQNSSTREVAFLPTRTNWNTGDISFRKLRRENRVYEELIERVDAARRHADKSI